MEHKGFFAALFDLSFSEFITIRIIKVLFVLAIILAGIAAIGIIIRGFAGPEGSAGGGVFALILAPIVFILWVLMARVWLEIIMVIFRIADNTTRMVELKESSGPSQGA